MDREMAMSELAALKAQQAELDAKMAEIEIDARKALAQRVIDFLAAEGATVSDALSGLKLLKPVRTRGRRAKAVVA